MQERIKELEMKAKELLQLVIAFVERQPEAQSSSGGITKFITKIKSEMNFYQRLLKTPENIRPIHIVCSNYVHLRAIYDLMIATDSMDVYRPIPFKGTPLRIDLITNQGQRWIKVKAGNQSHIEQYWDGSDDSEDSENEMVTFDVPCPTIIRQAKQLLQASQENKFHYKSPDIVFTFFSPVCPRIEQQLIDLGIIVEHGIKENKRVEEYSYLTDILNLDITTLLSILSDISHRFNEIPLIAFDSKPLKMQYESEKQFPILPFFYKIFNNRKLVTTFSAYQKCIDIVNVIGGPTEKARAFNLFKSSEPIDFPLELCTNLCPILRPDVEVKVPWKVHIIPNNPSDHFKSLNISKFTSFNIDVFGTADNLNISTITSNFGIKRALEKTGQNYSIIVHESRGLIEQKWRRYLSNKSHS
jgi:hypothetical protein